MRIAFFEIQEWERPLLEAAFPGHELSFFEKPLTAADTTTLKNCEALSVFIYSQVTADVIAALPDLKLITTRSTGFDHIDTTAAEARDIIVSNVPSYGEYTVAEHTFALILALSRNVHKSHVRRLAGNFSIEGLKGFDLKDKTIGVVGSGKIGRHVIQIARGFGMQVIASDAFPDAALATKLGFTYMPFEALLATSDIITLHTPYMPETHHLISSKNIGNIKRGAFLINTARGELVENKAMLQALESGILAGAGLDVLEGEHAIKEEKELLNTDESKDASTTNDSHALLAREDVVYTPHIAFYSEEALQRILSTTIENIQCYTEGQCQNIVNR